MAWLEFSFFYGDFFSAKRAKGEIGAFFCLLMVEEDGGEEVNGEDDPGGGDDLGLHWRLAR